MISLSYKAARNAAVFGLLFFAWSPLSADTLEGGDSPGMTVPVTAVTWADTALFFEANRGQVSNDVEFLARAGGYRVFLSGGEATLVTDRTGAMPLGLRFAGASASRQGVGVDQLPGRINYYLGKDPAKWRVGIPTYSAVRYDQIYPGIDVVFRDAQRRLEYDLIVAPGADPAVIRLAFAGTEPARLDSGGSLVLATTQGDMVLEPPVIYQEVAGERRPIEGGYVLTKGGEVAFRLGAYDKARPLVIDPVVVFGSFLGGNDLDDAMDIALGADGSAYVTGYTSSTDFPMAPTSPTGFYDAFVAKFSPDGGQLLYATTVGGSGSFDVKERGNAIAVDDFGNAHVMGRTAATDFPTVNAFQPAPGGGIDAFLFKLDPSGQIVFSTYLGGSSNEIDRDSDFLLNFTGDIAVDDLGQIYVAGSSESADFPVLNSIQGHAGAADIFVTKFDSSGQNLIFSTLLGSPFNDEAWAIALDQDRNVFVGGGAGSGYPTTPGALMTDMPPGGGGVVTKLSAAGDQLVYSTFVGSETGGGSVRGLALDSLGRAVVTGTTSSRGYPTTPGSYQPVHSDSVDSHPFEMVVSKLDADGSALVASTFFGTSTENERGEDIALDADDNVLLAMSSESHVGSSRTSGEVVKFDPTLSLLRYTSLVAGTAANDADAKALAADAAGDAYVVGEQWCDFQGSHAFFALTPDAFQTLHGSCPGRDGYVAKLHDTGLTIDTFVTFNLPGEFVLSATGGDPGETVGFLVSPTGTGDGPILTQLGGLQLNLLPPIMFVGGAATDTKGLASLTSNSGAGSGSTVFFQAILPRGPGGADSVKSNALEFRLP